MNSHDTPSDALIQLVDDYLGGALDEAGTAELECLLRQSDSARSSLTSNDRSVAPNRRRGQMAASRSSTGGSPVASI